MHQSLSWSDRLRKSPDADTAREAIRNAEDWIDSKDALLISSLMVQVRSMEVDEGVADLILRGRLRARFPALQSHYLSALKDPDPDRRLRALSRLDPSRPGVAGPMARIAVRPGDIRCRYEALKRLDASAEAGRISESTRVEILSEYERTAFPHR